MFLENMSFNASYSHGLVLQSFWNGFEVVKNITALLFEGV